jgi:hypothetical protein
MVTSRIWFTAKQKSELWERWKNGQSVLAISRALERRNKDRRPADRGSPWRDCSGATSQSRGSAEA